MLNEARPGERPEFDSEDGLFLAVSYLENPGDVVCPLCGPGRIEVVAYLDATELRYGRRIPASPEGDYAVVLFCRGCMRGAALSFRRPQPDEDRRAA
jgi:hypothetical protein